MKKKFFIISLLSILTVVIVYFAARYITVRQFAAQKIEIKQKTKDDKSTTELVKIYKYDIKKIISKYSVILDSGAPLDSNSIKRDKESLLSLRVPSEFKELHINIVFALINLEKYLENGRIDDLMASKNIIKKTKEQYSWL